MIVVMEKQGENGQLSEVIAQIEKSGCQAHVIHGVARTVVGVVGEAVPACLQGLERLPGVERLIPIRRPYKLAGRELKPEDTLIQLGDVKIGAGHFVCMAGPCAVENEEQVLSVARRVKAAGARVLRGGAFKPRTSPYSFQGLGEVGLRILAKARAETGLKLVSEVMNPAEVEVVAAYADILQVGARSMQNFVLLREVGKLNKPVLLKRGFAATIEEWLMAAEYILSEGNKQVILCERGIRTYETATRNTFDVAAIPLVKHLSHLPIIADPSHATGDSRLVGPVAKAAVAAGADGLLIEVHPDPQSARCDGAQSLTPDDFAALMRDVSAILSVTREETLCRQSVN